MARGPEVEGPLSGKRVLLVEDEDHLRTVVGMMVAELGAEVEAEVDGAQAVESFARDPSRIDLVLLDLHLRGLPGVETLERLRAIDPSVRVVASSGIEPERSLIYSLESRGGGFIEKPFDLDRLEEVLTAVVSRGIRKP